MLICEYLQSHAATRRPGSRKLGNRGADSGKPSSRMKRTASAKAVASQKTASAKGLVGQKTASSHRPGVGRKRTASAINKD